MKKLLVVLSLGTLLIAGCTNTKVSGENLKIKPAKVLYENTSITIRSGHDHEDNDVITFENNASYNMKIKVTQKKRYYSSSAHKYKTRYKVRETIYVDKYKQMHLRFTPQAHGSYQITIKNKDKGNCVDRLIIKYKE